MKRVCRKVPGLWSPVRVGGQSAKAPFGSWSFRPLGYAHQQRPCTAGQPRWIHDHEIRAQTPGAVMPTRAALTDGEYYRVSEEAMEELVSGFEDVLERLEDDAFDVEYSSGVCTLSLGTHGTYVINKQPPNKQLWLSSPESGPKRYEYDEERNCWVDIRDGTDLFKLMEEELTNALGVSVKLREQ